jgi:hypothetical protein
MSATDLECPPQSTWHWKALLFVLACIAVVLGALWRKEANRRQEQQVGALLRILKDEESCFHSEGFSNRTVELRLWGGRLSLYSAEQIVECSRVRWLSTYGLMVGPVRETLTRGFENEPVADTEIVHWHRRGSEKEPPEPDPD